MPPPPPPISTSSDPLPIPTSPKSLSTILTNDRNILHLLVYKSKNQHRSSLWFKWLQMLKRCLERITDHIQLAYPDKDDSPSDPDPDSDSEESESESDLKESRTSLITLLRTDKAFTGLLQRLFTAIIPNAHRAFTTLITSTQYAAMAMVMLGCLARVHEVLKPFADEKTEETVSEEQVDTKEPGDIIPSKEYAHEEDTGEVISRDSIIIQKHQRTRKVGIEEEEGMVIKRQKVEMQTTGRSLTPPTADEGTSTKDSKTRRTAIDDLFADF